MTTDIFEIIKLSAKPTHDNIKTKLSDQYQFDWFYDLDAGDCVVKTYNDIDITISLLDNNLHWFCTGNVSESDNSLAGDINIENGINLKEAMVKLKDVVDRIS